MASGPRGPLDRLWRAEQLMKEGKIDEARPLIEALQKEENLPSDARLTWQLLKSQLLIIVGDYKASWQLAEHVWKKSQEQGKFLQAVDACIVAAEALVEGGGRDEVAKAIVEGEQMLVALTNEAPAALAPRKASFVYLRGRICRFKGEIDRAMGYFQQSLALRRELSNKHTIAASLQNIGLVHADKGDMEQALDYYQQALKLFQEVGDKYRVGWCSTNIGAVYKQKREFDNALQYCTQGLTLFQEVGSKDMIVYSLHFLGRIYHAKGDLEQALDYYQQHRSISEELGDKWRLAGCIATIGDLYWQRGEIDLAEECFQQSLALSHEIDNKLFIASNLGYLGLIHWQKGNLEQAMANLEKELSYSEEQGLNLNVGFQLYWLILVSLDKGPPEQTQQYLDRLQSTHEQENDKALSQAYRVAQALVLKASPRIRDKVRAQELLQQLTEEEEMFDFFGTQLAMVNLCELLLDELKAYGELSVFQEAKSLVDRLYSVAQAQHSLSLVVNSLILKGKFAMIEGDLTTAARYLEQARMTAEEKGLVPLTEKVTAEKHQLEAQYETWEQLIQRNAPFRERVEHARIVDYLKDAEKLVSAQRLELSS